MGNTAMQEVATVLVAHSGLVPEGSSRSRAASELAEMFARADGETEALPACPSCGNGHASGRPRWEIGN